MADRTEPFVSRVRAGLAGRTAELERLAVEMFARGLSTRDIEAAFRDATGGSLLSRTAVSQITYLQRAQTALLAGDVAVRRARVLEQQPHELAAPLDRRPVIELDGQVDAADGAGSFVLAASRYWFRRL